MSIAQRLVNLSDGLSAEGILSAAKGGTGTTTGAGSSTPTISSINYGGDDTATNPAGGATVTLTGTNFASGARVLINQTAVSVVTVVSATQITFTAPALSAGSYILYVVNLDGSTAIAVPGIQYSGTPAWTTAAGSLGTSYETAPVSTTVSATSDSTVTYSVVSGTLPDGVVINSSGTISGTSPAVGGSTTYTFTVRATDGELQDTDREFSLTINPDVVTWSTPTSIALQQDAASSTTLSASSATGQAISYSVDTLPAGLTLSGATVSGTATTAGTTTTTATATAAVTGKTAQQTITWTVSIAADAYWKYTTLLLNAETVTSTFLSDASSNNFSLTAYGDTKPSNLSPYVPIASSVYFNGSSDYLTSSGNAAIATGEFTVEAWIFPTALNTSNTVLDNSLWNIGQNGGYTFSINSTGKLVLGGSTGVWNSSSTWITSTNSVVINRWQHVAITRDSSNVIRCFINGVIDPTTTTYSASLNLSTAGGVSTNISRTVADGGTYNYFAGYISNVHAANGTGACKYTTTFTPSVYPIVKTATTVFLACNSRRLVDASTNAFTLTAGGSAAINNFNPFLTNPSYGTYGSTYFDGSGDYISIPTGTAAALGTTGTVEFWYYPITSPATARIINNGISAATCMDVYDANGQIGFSNAGYTTSAVKLNTWTHIACVINAGVLKIYFNGVSQPLAGTTTGLNLTATGDVWIGGINGYSQWTNGYVSNLRFVKGTAVYTADFTPPTEPLTAVANTSLLTCQTNQPHTNSQFLDNSTSAFSVTRTGNATQGSFSPYGASWSNYFDGSGDYLEIVNNSAFNFGTSDFTVECWANHSGTSQIQSMVSTYQGSTAGWSFQWRSDTGKLALGHGDTQLINYTFTPTVGTWYHYAVSRTGTSLKLFINGTVVATVTDSTNITSTAPLVVGNISTTIAQYTYGYLSNLRIVKGTAVYTSNFTPPTAPLTPIAGTSLLTCQSQNFVDNSPNAFALTRNGDVSVQRFSPFATVTQTPTTHSVYFDGSGDYLTAPSNAVFGMSTDDFTWEAWVYPTQIANGSGIISIGSVELYIRNSAGGNTVAYYDGSTAVVTSASAVTANQWSHVALVRSSGNLKIYLNGVGGAGVSYSSSVGSNSTCYIGVYSNLSSDIFTGYISNLRIVKGTAVYTSNFTPTTQPLTAVAGTSLLTCQDAVIRDNSANNFTLTAAGNATPRRQNPFGFTTSSAQDYTPAVFGSSTYFDGTGDYISVPDNVVFTMGAGDFTLECWVYLTSISQQVFIGTCDAGGNQGSMSFILGITSTGTPRVSVGYGGSLYHSSAASDISTGQWYHIAGVRYGAAVNVYVNGVKGSNQNFGSLAITDSSQVVAIGRNGNYNGEYVTGYISDVRIVKGTALYRSNFVPPQAPLQAVQNTVLLLNMDRAAVVDRSGKVVLETVGDARLSTAVKKYGTSSLYFDGTGDYLTFPSNPQYAFGTGDFTIECWVNSADVSSSQKGFLQTSATAGGFQTTYTSGITFLFGAGTSGGSAVSLNGGVVSNIAGTYVGSSTAVITANTWTHLALVRSNGTATMYVNGVSVGSGTAAGNCTGTNLVVGGYYSTGYLYNGYIDDFRITRGYARYTANFTPPTQALLTK